MKRNRDKIVCKKGKRYELDGDNAIGQNIKIYTFPANV